MSKKKLTKTEIESNLLAENVRVLRCGLYGYVLNGKEVFKSSHLPNVNNFAEYANEKLKDILQQAARMQQTEPLFIPNELPNTTGERIVAKGNNWGAKIKVPNH